MASEKLGEGRFDLTADASQLKKGLTEAKQAIDEHQQAADAAAKAQEEANRQMREAENAAKQEAAAVKAATEAREKRRQELLREVMARAALAQVQGDNPEAVRQLERAQRFLTKTTAERAAVAARTSALVRAELLREREAVDLVAKETEFARKRMRQGADEARKSIGGLGGAIEKMSSLMGRLAIPIAVTAAVDGIVARFTEARRRVEEFQKALASGSSAAAADLQQQAMAVRGLSEQEQQRAALQRRSREEQQANNDRAEKFLRDQFTLTGAVTSVFTHSWKSRKSVLEETEKANQRINREYSRQVALLEEVAAKERERQKAAAEAAAADAARANQQLQLQLTEMEEGRQAAIYDRFTLEKRLLDEQIREARRAENDQLAAALEARIELLRRIAEAQIREDQRVIDERTKAEDAARAERERKERESAERQAKAYERAFRDATRSVFDQQNAVNEKILTTVEAISATLGAIQRTGGR